MENIIAIIYELGLINIALGIVGFLLIIFFFIKKSGAYKYKKEVVNNLNNQQTSYCHKRQDSTPKLTLQEKLELSWKFLYEITDIIINKFSIQDKHTVQQIGQNLVDSGMKYEHIIDLGIKPDRLKAQTLDLEQEKDLEDQGARGR